LSRNGAFTTGANRVIGFETARELEEKGTAGDRDKGQIERGTFVVINDGTRRAVAKITNRRS
jgi:hypothetical protein